MDEQTAVDRILENENLTDGLEDDEANWLIEWGVAQVTKVIIGVEDDEQAGNKVNDVGAVMRMLNQIASDRAVKSPELLAQDVKTFFRTYAAVFSSSRALKRGEAKRISTQISTLSTGEALQYLITAAEQSA